MPKKLIIKETELMKVIKRSGAEVEFDINKIKSAIVRANAQTETEGQVTE